MIENLKEKTGHLKQPFIHPNVGVIKLKQISFVASLTLNEPRPSVSS
jgi:hypothetical protein